MDNILYYNTNDDMLERQHALTNVSDLPAIFLSKSIVAEKHFKPSGVHLSYLYYRFTEYNV